jgi:hypothetical protein
VFVVVCNKLKAENALKIRTITTYDVVLFESKGCCK